MTILVDGGDAPCGALIVSKSQDSKASWHRYGRRCGSSHCLGLAVKAKAPALDGAGRWGARRCWHPAVASEAFRRAARVRAGGRAVGGGVQSTGHQGLEHVRQGVPSAACLETACGLEAPARSTTRTPTARGGTGSCAANRRWTRAPDLERCCATDPNWRQSGSCLVRGRSAGVMPDERATRLAVPDAAPRTGACRGAKLQGRAGGNRAWPRQPRHFAH